jgi:hypothetical protein
MKTVTPAELLKMAAARQKVSTSELESRYQEIRKSVNEAPAANVPTTPFHFTYEPEAGDLDVTKIQFR